MEQGRCARLLDDGRGGVIVPYWRNVCVSNPFTEESARQSLLFTKFLELSATHQLVPAAAPKRRRKTQTAEMGKPEPLIELTEGE